VRYVACARPTGGSHGRTYNELLRNAEGAQSERARSLTRARQNNAANNPRIMKARPGHHEG
jgi:hypothetical protein